MPLKTYNRKELIGIYKRVKGVYTPVEIDDNQEQIGLKILVSELGSQCFDQIDTIQDLEEEKANFIERMKEFKTSSLALLDLLEIEVGKAETELEQLQQENAVLALMFQKVTAEYTDIKEENTVLKRTLELAEIYR